MKRTPHAVALSLTALAATVTLAACSSSTTPATTSMPMTSAAGSTMASAMASPMGTGASAGAAALPAGTEADVTFAQLMIPHHEQAVQMADLALHNATTPEVKQLAAQIKAAQDPEITMMTGWLKGWGAPMQMASSSSMQSMSMSGQNAAGMMSDADMTALSHATGAAFDTMWLTLMINHHEGAITMANNLKAASTTPEVTALADSIISGQTAEIATMKALLNT